ncbi:MAG: esterase/lipase family protein, partial [Bacteroidales bacterium]
LAQVRVQPESAVSTGILYDLSVPLSGIERFDGSADAAVNSTKNWYQVLFELSNAAVAGQDFPEVAQIRAQAKSVHETGVIPLGLIQYRYNRLEGETPPPVENGIADLTNLPLGEHTVFTTAALIEKTYRGNSVSFVLDESLMFTNTGEKPAGYRISFGKDLPFTAISPGAVTTHSFAETGLKIIRMQALMPDGRVLHSAFYFEVVRLDTPAPTATWALQSDIPYMGSTTTGDAFVYLADGHDRVVQPVVICEGIDFEDNYGWDALYTLFNQQNMLEDLRAQGFDAVVLNFHEPMTHIQRNAMLMTKLLQMVNDSLATPTQLIVVGPSMGGLVSRYALTYMEHNNLEHNAGLYISFETPHLGANMPLGLQYEIFFFKDLDANVQMLLDVLDEPAPRQMLVYHYTDPPSATAGSDPLFEQFQTDIANIGGYPQNLRKIALSNGRGDAIGQPFNAGDQVIEYDYSSILATVKGNVWAVEDNASGQIFEGLINSIFMPNDQLNVTVFSEQPYDNAPGGSRSTFADMDTIQAPIGDIIALHDNHCFIPTVSGLAIAGEGVFHNLAADPQIMQKTPFDTIYWSAENYDHTFISPETAAVVIGEVLNSLPEKHTVQLDAGWNDLSGYVDPTDKDLESLTAPLNGNLIILQNPEGFYWPAGGVTTLGEWSYQNGYFIKLSAADSLVFSGEIPESNALQIVAGWNLIPVLSPSALEITTLFGSNLNKVEIIREGIGFGIFWPSKGIQTITAIEPGRAYLLKASEDFVLDFGE